MMLNLADRLLRLWRIGVLGVLLPLLLSGCVIQPPATGASLPRSVGLHQVSLKSLPGWETASVETGLATFLRSCGVIQVLPEDQTLGGRGLAASLGGKAGQWRPVCAAARAVPPGNARAARAFFEAHFTVYEVSGVTRITGYFEPLYPGSEIRLPGYTVPIYGKPRNIVRADLGAFKPSLGRQEVVGRLRYGVLVPYYSRAQINEGAIIRDASVVAWLRNPVDAYMAQLQGSARLRLPDGTLIDIGFDGTNGRAYTPIGKLMVQKRYLPADDVSIDSIAAWLRTHPEEAAGLMDANKNYVFMKRISGVPTGFGAPGALGVPLTPTASVAVDPAAIPLGAPVFVLTRKADTLAVAQDIDVSAHGGSGAQIFCGVGRDARRLAAATHEDGRMFVFLPRSTPTVVTAEGAS